jgi:hypothetical protein
MDIHKPKPWHGVHELLKEIGIIVIGVLIALGAEQSVEWLHWRERATHAETAMRQDVNDVLDGMMERIEIQPCLDRRLVAMRDRLIASGPQWAPMSPFITSGPPAGSTYATYAHPMHTWPTASWLNAVASTAATHLPDARLTHYADIFARAEREEADQTTEHEQSSQLNVLGSPLTLTPDQKIDFLRLIEAERGRNRLMGYESRNGLRHFQALGLDIEKARADVRTALFYRTCVADGLV